MQYRLLTLDLLPSYPIGSKIFSHTTSVSFLSFDLGIRKANLLTKIPVINPEMTLVIENQNKNHNRF